MQTKIDFSIFSVAKLDSYSSLLNVFSYIVIYLEYTNNI